MDKKDKNNIHCIKFYSEYVYRNALGLLNCYLMLSCVLFKGELISNDFSLVDELTVEVLGSE